MSWQDKQIWTVGKYRRMAKLPEDEYRRLLHEVTGCSSTKDPEIRNRDYGMFMARLEAVLQWRVEEGFVPSPWSDTVKQTYWRDRLNGDDHRRLQHLIYDLWAELKTTLPGKDQDTAYLRSIAAVCCRRKVENISDLTVWQRCILIEALKARIFQNRKAASELRAGLPGFDQEGQHHDPIIPRELAEVQDPEAAPDQPETAYHGVLEEAPF